MLPAAISLVKPSRLERNDQLVGPLPAGDPVLLLLMVSTIELISNWYPAAGVRLNCIYMLVFNAPVGQPFSP